MLKTHLFALLIFTSVAFVPAFSQIKKATISGYIKDASSGESLLGASITIKQTGQGVVANEYGFYSITLPQGFYTLKIAYLGYTSIVDSFVLKENSRKSYNMTAIGILQKEIVITAESARQNVESSQMGTENIAIEKIKTLPVILGEVDILKTLQLLPGVQSAGEGSSGFYVRGGGPDQNLVLLDEAVIYNSGHLFGFFSIFNSDAINNVTLIKGGMPAEFGGRLSSVVDVNMKEGNNQKFHATGGIGLIASRLTLEGPIQKNKSSFIVSGRRTYIDALVKPFAPKGSTLANSGYYFYDLNTKINYQFSDKDRVFLSGYFGRDKLNFKSDRFGIEFPWGNATTSLRWNHLFNDKMFINTTAIFSDYTFTLGATQNSFDFKLFSGIQDYNLKSDVDFFPTIRHHVKFGGAYTYHIFTPSTVTGKAGDVDLSPEKINKQYANEGAFYLSDDYDLTEHFRINAGLRYSIFQQIGPYDRYIEDANGTVTDTIAYSSWEHIKFYHGLEPRVSMRYQLNRNSSIKASYTLGFQYLHLASTSGGTLPADLWIPSSERVKPQKAQQYAIGYFRNLFNDVIETSVEVYYRYLENQIDFRDGAVSRGINANVENKFTFGKGQAYGSEFFIKKRTGKFTGWIGYTLSYTTRNFPEINNGITYYAKYDRRHDGSIVLSYELNKKWTFGSVFVYGSGSAFSAPSNYFFVSGNSGLYYGSDYRNKFRLIPYHRLDISATYYRKRTEKRESSWNFSIYNVYNRQNQYAIFLEQEGQVLDGSLKTRVMQITIFPIMPSITWNFKF